MSLPPNIDDLISSVLAAAPNTIIINQSGTPVSMPWHNSASSIIQAWYGGNESGNGTADVIFGDFNPCGRLPLSWPKDIRDTPAFLNFGAVNGRVLYGEDVYVGYKYYDMVERPPLFPFGYVSFHASPDPDIETELKQAMASHTQLLSSPPSASRNTILPAPLPHILPLSQPPSLT